MSETPARRLVGSLNFWFRRPPRIHGEVDTERTVGFLELLYDLVFVVIVAQLAHHLVGDPTWSTVAEYSVLFGLVWVAWLNGSLYHELHGREDGRHRNYIFAQMYLLVLLAAFAGQAAGSDGRKFSLTLAALMLLLTFQWWVISRIDTVPQFWKTSMLYVCEMLLIVAIMVISAFIPSIRIELWAIAILLTVAGFSIGANFLSSQGQQSALQVTESLVERFKLFTIIVLGEIVAAVVNGIIDAEAATSAVITGLIALTIGFGVWWNYFDTLGQRIPRAHPRSTSMFLLLHLPLHASIAAVGGGMLGLVEAGPHGYVQSGTAWLLSGGTAVVLLALAAILSTLEPAQNSTDSARLQIVLAGGAICALLLALLNLPTMWFAVLLALTLIATWTIAFTLRSLSGEYEALRQEQLAADNH